LRLSNNLKLIDGRLKDNKWLAGPDFTAADIMNFYPLTTQRYFGPQVSLAAYPNILRWLKDCSERPAFRSYAGKADPQMKILIGAEPPKISIARVGGAKSDIWKKAGTKLS
jgi:glutathione S-transferase